jgi:hypothetical protein
MGRCRRGGDWRLLGRGVIQCRQRRRDAPYLGRCFVQECMYMTHASYIIASLMDSSYICQSWDDKKSNAFLFIFYFSRGSGHDTQNI